MTFRKAARRTLLITAVTLLTAAASYAQARQPKTVREFFELLPQKYFPLEGCGANPTKANCDLAWKGGKFTIVK